MKPEDQISFFLVSTCCLGDQAWSLRSWTAVTERYHSTFADHFCLISLSTLRLWLSWTDFYEDVRAEIMIVLTWPIELSIEKHRDYKDNSTSDRIVTTLVLDDAEVFLAVILLKTGNTAGTTTLVDILLKKKKKVKWERQFLKCFFLCTFCDSLWLFPNSSPSVRTWYLSLVQWTGNGSCVLYNPQIHPTLTSYHANLVQFEGYPAPNHMPEIGRASCRERV